MKTKDEYISYLHKKLDDWNRDIDRLMDNVDRIDEKSRTELHQNIQALKNKRDNIEEKISELNQSGGEAWEDIKSGLELAREAMNSAVKSATSRFFK
ncbi:MAG: hypothetical protein ACWGOX_03540 [Desulforhopalus sp.]